MKPGGKMSTLKEIGRRIIYRTPGLFSIYQEISYARHQSRIEADRRAGRLKLHLACGEKLLDGWLNVDMRLNPVVLTLRFPEGLQKFGENSVRYIYTSHFLEHIEYPNTALEFLRACRRILKPGGVLRIAVPDIEGIIKAYARDDREFFEIQRIYHPPRCTTKLEHLMYALQQDGEHQFGYDFETLQKLLLQAGFQEVVRSDYNQSELDELRVDYREEIDNHQNNLSLFVDAIK
jgi:predicted SAM-dependent methyltransferase